MRKLSPNRCARRSGIGSRGFTLTEIAIVLGVVGIVLGGIWAAAALVSQNDKTQEASQDIALIVANYRSLFSTRGIDYNNGYWTDFTCFGIQNNAFPSSMIVPGTSCAGPTATPSTYPQMPWGGGSIIKVYTQENNQTIQLSIEGLTSTACNQIADQLFAQSGITYEEIYNGSWNGGWMPPYGNNTPWTVTQVAGLCTGGWTIVQVGYSAR
ncbi:MAG TPA: prepilin-type N-terminal cleavage/methylation domain-containing protein [Alphaproteobacteria bacterium]|nr:prepilin-type N-terminal cleavage/methylation domain-containing protein [Alphaproteobacteria bacterium]